MVKKISNRKNEDRVIAEVKTVLNKVYWQDQEVKTKTNQLEELRSLAEYVGSQTDEVKVKGSTAGGHDTSVDRIIKKEKSINVSVKALTRERDRIEKLIKRVPDDRLRILLELRYLEYCPWAAIAQRLHYDTRYVYRLHRQAQLEVGKIMGIR